jgi:hypothetical protein
MTHAHTDGAGRAHHVGPCIGKVGYLDGKLAEWAAQQLADDLNVRADVYRCKYCGELHVGKSMNGRFTPNREIEPEQEGEHHELVTKKRVIEGILGEMRYGSTAGMFEKKRRLVGQLSSLDLRLSELKKLRREREDASIRERDSAGRSTEGGEHHTGGNGHIGEGK